MRALDGRTGEQLWLFDTESDGCYSSPAFDGETIYIGSEGKKNKSFFFAIDAESGQLKWKFPAKEKILSTPSVVDEVVYFHARDDHVYALNVNSGEQLWCSDATFKQKEFQILRDLSKSSTAVTHDSVLVGVGTELKCLDRATGKLKWEAKTEGKVDSSPVVCGNTIYVGSDDRNFYAIDITSGKKIWNYKTGGRISASPSIGDGLVVIGSNDGILYAFEELVD